MNKVSVVVAAIPDEGKQAMEAWFVSPNPHIGWVMRENLKKKRLLRMDERWSLHWQAALQT